MLAFVKSERRDFQPNFDITIVDFPDQARMTLSTDIRYKSNWQQGALKGQPTHRFCTHADVYAPPCSDPPQQVDHRAEDGLVRGTSVRPQGPA